MKLAEAFRMAPDACVALVGAGGKTTSMFKLAREQSSQVFLTATTHLAEAQLALADQHFIVEHFEDVDVALESILEGVVLFTGPYESHGRMNGVGNNILEHLLSIAKENRIPLIIEADGSRQLPLKAPENHEPLIPFVESAQNSANRLDAVVVVAGLSGLGMPLTPEWVHRPQRFAELSGLEAGDTITTQALVNVLTHPQGGLKRIPQGIRRVLLLNQADTSALQSQAHAIANRVVLGEKNSLGYHAVVIASMESNQVFAVHEPIAGIVLAAGEASRFGSPKQLLKWEGETLVRRTARIALAAGLDPVVVVIGAHAEGVRSSLEGLGVQLVSNLDWSNGMSTSVRTGVAGLPAYTGGAVFLLVDQPFVQPELLRVLVETHSRSLDPIVGPLAGGKRGNPVLFDQVTFPDLLRIEGDRGGRQLFSKFSPTWIPWHDDRILKEIDSPEDYTALMGLVA